ncbi:MAG: VCBS repeat-containing protein [Candidatus Rokubacteria bacterium]|nr:VCBS repeat-containing protein [Candidatus Rokubacteria bacterium]
MEEAVKALLADLFTERPAGRVVSVQGSGHLVVNFPGPAPPTDAEYLVVRTPAAGGSGFADMVGAVRIAEARGQTARATVLWNEGDLRPGDQVVWPPRITIVLLRTEAGDSPELAGLERHLDRWLELELLTDRRLRVVRADQPAEERWRLKRLQEEREYALTIAPLLLSGAAGNAVVLRVRSMFTGQTLAQRQAAWVSAQTQAAPTPASPTTSPAPSTPYGAAIRPAEPARAIQRVERSADHQTVPLPHALNGIALGDVDGDGRPEVIGITDQQVIVYRWTGRDLAPVATSDPLPAFTTYLSVDAADINGNGKDEIILTAVRTAPRQNQMENILASSIAELDKGRIELLQTNLHRYLRVLRRPGQPPLLLAQGMGLYEPFEGAVKALEWKDGRYQLGAQIPLPQVVPSVYAFASGDLDGDGRADLALVAPDGQLKIYDEEGQLRWESEDDLGEVDALGFAQTPRFPDYRGLNFDATAEQLAIWRSIPRRILLASVPRSAALPDIVTVANPRVFGLRVSLGKKGDSVRGGALGYGWDAEARRFAKRWESADVSGQALDLAIGDLGGDGGVMLVVLSGAGTKRSLDVFTLYDPRRAAGDAERR